MIKSTPPDPYRSARDLPSVAEMIVMLQGGKLVTRVIARKQRPELLRIEEQLNELTRMIDDFYALLGPRHWIFHESLNVDTVAGLLRLPADAAERALIDSYKDADRLSFMVGQVRRFPQLQVRYTMLQRAMEDYLAARYDAAVLLLIAVMDGFVNDFEVEHGRRGLHARDADEMVAWDSIVGHHLGLTQAHQTFTKSFSKTSDEEVHDLYRNGIVHGMLVNFNNDIVATKGWNRLFAVVDWATSREKQAVPPEPKPRFRDTLKSIADNARAKEALDAWKPSSLKQPDDGFDDDPIVRLATEYLLAWRSKNYGAMAKLLATMVRDDDNLKKLAGQVRDDYEPFELNDFAVTACDYEAPAICEVAVELQFEDVMRSAGMRWLREGPDGMGTAPNEGGEWRLINWGPSAMLNWPAQRAARHDE